MTDATSTTALGVDKDAAERTSRNLKEDAKTVAASVSQRAKETADRVRRTASEQAGVASEWAQDQADVLRDTVQTKPFISIGVSAASAFAAGLVLGVLLTRR